MPRSESLRRAQERHDARRPRPIGVRFTELELEALDQERRKGESRGQAVKRIVVEKITQGD